MKMFIIILISALAIGVSGHGPTCGLVADNGSVIPPDEFKWKDPLPSNRPPRGEFWIHPTVNVTGNSTVPDAQTKYLEGVRSSTSFGLAVTDAFATLLIYENTNTIVRTTNFQCADGSVTSYTFRIPVERQQTCGLVTDDGSIIPSGEFQLKDPVPYNFPAGGEFWRHQTVKVTGTSTNPANHTKYLTGLRWSTSYALAATEALATFLIAEDTNIIVRRSNFQCADGSVTSYIFRVVGDGTTENPLDGTTENPPVDTTENPPDGTTEDSLPNTTEEVEITTPEVGDDCDPLNCKHTGYCYEYKFCNKTTLKWELMKCSDDLFWNPENGTQAPVGTCDLWTNLPTPVQIQYKSDPNCFPPCEYKENHPCSSDYLYQDGNTDKRQEMKLSCPVDTRNNVSLVWVQEREACDYCFNAKNAQGSPCCIKY